MTSPSATLKPRSRHSEPVRAPETEGQRTMTVVNPVAHSHAGVVLVVAAEDGFEC